MTWMQEVDATKLRCGTARDNSCRTTYLPVVRATVVMLIGAIAAACQSARQSRADTIADTSDTSKAAAASATPGARGLTTRTDTAAPSDAVTLRLDRTAYGAGAIVTMRVANHTPDTLGYNQCSNRVVEQQKGASWDAHDEPDRVCTMELRLLMPHETQTARTDLPATLPNGTFRIVLSLTAQRSTPSDEPPAVVKAVSPSFRVD
jgi:hypothetical protein